MTMSTSDSTVTHEYSNTMLPSDECQHSETYDTTNSFPLPTRHIVPCSRRVSSEIVFEGGIVDLAVMVARSKSKSNRNRQVCCISGGERCLGYEGLQIFNLVLQNDTLLDSLRFQQLTAVEMIIVPWK
ncbi:hypothetical protein An12g03540 [Aspergillus niger]|uniref:Uncharacterized protein n=2 Tax=Aspergillus niger TaxID=5061 RepID=A2QZ40_ASPNC|nr:hypothetical protein An12g03540 [Aspergillus niger]CAK46125.1 hypothetical protein An12g03540 [Aspergillus niger]